MHRTDDSNEVRSTMLCSVYRHSLSFGTLLRGLVRLRTRGKLQDGRRRRPTPDDHRRRFHLFSLSNARLISLTDDGEASEVCKDDGNTRSVVNDFESDPPSASTPSRQRFPRDMTSRSLRRP